MANYSDSRYHARFKKFLTDHEHNYLNTRVEGYLIKNVDMQNVFMKLLRVYLLLFSLNSNGQDSLSRYTDFHIHTTYKHFNRPCDCTDMNFILQSVIYKPGTKDSYAEVYIPPALKQIYRQDNWENYLSSDKKMCKTPKKRDRVNAMEDGQISDLRNYDQASFYEVSSGVPGSILCTCLYPFEKQYTEKKSQVRINSMLVTKMGFKRLSYYRTDEHNPLKDFMSEYFYALCQDDVHYINQKIPDNLYEAKTKYPSSYTGYYNKIKMVKDIKELKKIIKSNDAYFKEKPARQRTDTIITPLILTIEGGQVLYGDSSGIFPTIIDPENPDAYVENELLNNALALKRLPNHLFFITPGHFTQNHVVGYAKTLDRDPNNMQHRAPALLSQIPQLYPVLFRKKYEGFNIIYKQKTETHKEKVLLKNYKPRLKDSVKVLDGNGDDTILQSYTFYEPDSLGYKIVDSFLSPDNNPYRKPTYIDVKHMDIKGRIQYYYFRRQLEQKYNRKIPIVASHFGVSGEKQPLAVATGTKLPYFTLLPSSKKFEWKVNLDWDRYKEINETKKYYRHMINAVDRFMNSETNITYHFRYDYENSIDSMSFDYGMYSPLNFMSDSIFKLKAFDPFAHYDSDTDKNVGWYYPWSLNLFDEEIIEIEKSDGIIGILLDPRQLGAYAQNYTTRRYKNGWKKTVIAEFKKINPDSLKAYGLAKDDLNPIEYMKCEPFFRNVFHIIKVLKQEQDAEKIDAAQGFSTARQQYYWYVKDSVHITEKDPWQLVSIGGDFDGLIDPISMTPTVSYLPLLRKKMIAYAYVYALLHKDIFCEPHTDQDQFVHNMYESRDKLHKIFYENGKNFITKYF